MTSIIAFFLALTFSIPASQSPETEFPSQNLEGYRLVGLELTGTTVLHLKTVKEKVFPMDDEEIFDPKRISAGMEKINEVFNNLGYVDFSYTPRFDINHDDKTVSCSFHLVQGKQYFINRVEIVNPNSVEPDREMRSVIGPYMKEGYPFSPVGYYQARKKLEEYLEDKRLTIKDFEYKRDTENSTETTESVNISIRLESR
jgi:outer membrane translocation and assembly module TamA